MITYIKAENKTIDELLAEIKHFCSIHSTLLIDYSLGEIIQNAANNIHLKIHLVAKMFIYMYDGNVLYIDDSRLSLETRKKYAIIRKAAIMANETKQTKG